MGNKVVLIVNNEEINSGMLKVLADHRDSGFVRKYIGYEIDNEELMKRDFKPILNPDSPFLFISGSGMKLEQRLTKNQWAQDFDILLVHDKVNPSDYLPYFNEETLVMYHRKPENLEAQLSRINIKSYKQGEHEKDHDQGGYSRLVYLIEAYDEDKGRFKPSEYIKAIEKLISWFSVNDELDIRLKLLSCCSTAERARTVSGVEGYVSLKESVVTDEISIDSYIKKHFASKNQDESLSDEYIEKLTTLRNRLLESIENKT